MIAYRGVVDNATYDPINPVSPGDVCIVRGEQLSLRVPATAEGFPLPTGVNGATVLVNDVAAPLFYTSSGQIAFQMPYDTAAGTALVQVVREGQAGNTVTVNVLPRVPQIVAVTDAAYQLRDARHPTKAGETLILWVIGLGATNPPVQAGAAAPLDPPAVAVSVPQVGFSGKDAFERLTPGFAGLSPGSAGLYQVIVTVPADVLPGPAYIWVVNPDWSGNVASLVVQ
jgi:uncharacterized protein (TIGR03437 family)